MNEEMHTLRSVAQLLGVPYTDLALCGRHQRRHRTHQGQRLVLALLRRAS